MAWRQIQNALFSRFRQWIQHHPVLRAEGRQSVLQQWRGRILFSFLGGGLVLGAATFIPVSIYAFTEKKWALLLLDLLVYGTGVYLFVSRRLPYNVRSALALLICYCVGVYVIVLVGFFSGGPAWLFGFAVMAGCLRGLRSAVAALCLNASTLVLLGGLAAAGMISGATAFFQPIELAVTAGFNFMLLNTISAVSVAVLVRGLESTTLQEQAAVRTLTDERERLIRSREELRKEVSERIGAERALVRSESRYRALVETSPDIIFQIDFEGKILFASPAFTEIIGVAPEGVDLREAKDLVHPDDMDKIRDAVDRLHEKGAVRNLEFRVKTAGGRQVWLSTNAAATLAESGKSRLVFGVSKDITEKMEAEARLKSAHSKLEKRMEHRTAALRAANESLQREMQERLKLQARLIRSERLAATGQLAASVAHEINSPLQGVSALLNVMLRKRGIDPEMKENLDLIKGAFERIRDTVRNLLDLNRPGNEAKKPLDVNQVVENTMALTRNFVKKNRIEVALDLSEGLPPVLGSPQQLGQVLINLINNSVEAISGEPEPTKGAVQSPLFGGEIRISTRAKDGLVHLRVADNGPGIPESALENIFDPFYTRKKTMGMGVGLSICHGIVEDHGGTIMAENGKNGGAVLTLTLPGG